MNVYFGLVICFLPFLLCFIIFKLCLKTKLSHMFLASLLGLLAVLPISFIQFWLEGYFPEHLLNGNGGLGRIFLKTLLLNGILEEMMKMLFITFVPAKKNTLSVYFSLAVLCGLCLGCFESMVYLLQNLQSNKISGGQFLWNLIFIRIFSSDFIHMFCAGLCGLFIWSCKNKKPDFLCLIFAVLTHGLYDFFLSVPGGMRWFSIAAILLAALECRVRYTRQHPVLNADEENQKEDLAEEVVEKTIDGVRLEGNKLVKEKKL